jgi:predicted ATP-dependent Lon-type protease
LTSTPAFEVPVPSQDVLRATATTTSRSALALEISTRSDNAAVAVTATGAVKLITAAQIAASTTTTATGTQTLSLTANDSGKVTFYAYNTSTTAGSITVVESGTTPASNTIWVKGTTDANNAYKLSATAPSIAGLGSTVDYTATVADMFGNALTTAVVKSETLGGDSTGADASMAYDTVTKVYEGDFTNRTTAGSTALLVSIAVSADKVTAFGAKTTSVFFSINGADLQAAITALQAEVAALKADYNALADRWNKRVADKKAPKKAVTKK